MSVIRPIVLMMLMVMVTSCAYQFVYQGHACQNDLSFKGIEQFSKVNFERSFSAYQFMGGFMNIDRPVNFCEFFYGDRDFGTYSHLNYKAQIKEFEWVSRVSLFDIPFLIIPGISKRTIDVYGVVEENVQ
jgi:hypothetical protein